MGGVTAGVCGAVLGGDDGAVVYGGEYTRGGGELGADDAARDPVRETGPRPESAPLIAGGNWTSRGLGVANGESRGLAVYDAPDRLP